MRRFIVSFMTLAAISRIAGAQSEAALRSAFEGRMVTVKVDMPATSKGIDVYPLDAMPVNWREMADRMKDNGTAIRTGQTAMITKVVLKKDHIEVQLGGGGYGTFGDNSGSAVSTTDESESKLERQLRDSVKSAPTSAKKKEFERQLSNAKSERERENSRARAAAALANEAREANLRAKRVESGSRFNIWYKPSVPADAAMPDGVVRALLQYADFANTGTNAATNSSSGMQPGVARGSSNALASIKKGLLVADVETLLGPANTASESKEGRLTVVTRNYLYDGKKIVASFVNGVLIDYSIAPQ